jgi:hypothetical protein
MRGEEGINRSTRTGADVLGGNPCGRGDGSQRQRIFNGVLFLDHPELLLLA